jgi:hypothetical protein
LCCGRAGYVIQYRLMATYVVVGLIKVINVIKSKIENNMVARQIIYCKNINERINLNIWNLVKVR